VNDRHLSSDDRINWSLVNCLQSGETVAFDSFYEQYRRLVFQCVFRIVADSALAEDVTQPVFLKLWVSPTAYHGGPLEAWLRLVSRNCALDELRRRRRFAELPPIASDEATPFERVAAKLDAQRLHDALNMLTSPQRSVIELNFFAGLTHEQIAAYTSIPLGTVKTRIRTGLQTLKCALTDLPMYQEDRPSTKRTAVLARSEAA
jgi:RNA polymerase sigma-70 factor, ECF subfamily